MMFMIKIILDERDEGYFAGDDQPAASRDDVDSAVRFQTLEAAEAKAASLDQIWGDDGEITFAAVPDWPVT